MEGSKESLTPTSKLLGWGSLLLAFGAVQGVIYLKAYWSRFGLDPFQYADVDSLALVGLTSIGATLAIVGLGALAGGYIGSKMDAWVQRAPFLRWLVPIALIVFVFVLALIVKFGVYLVLGMFLTWFVIWLIHQSSDVPPLIKKSALTPYVVLALAYVPLGSYYFGQRDASKVINSSVEAKVLPLPTNSALNLRLAGRLGDSYVFYRADDHSVLVVPSNKIDALALRK